MTATADSIIERRRLRKRLAFWRILAILALVILVISIVPWRSGSGRADHVARISIEGTIANDPDRLARIRRIGEDEKARALIVRISSPGGTVVGSEALYDVLREVAEEKPVVALVGEVAASGGYIVALATDRVFMRRNSITGSIGVVSLQPDVTELLSRLGVSVREVKSSPLKAAPNPLVSAPPEAIEALEALVADSYAWFEALVGERRGLEGAALDAVADGRVFSGAQALENGLADEIGDETAARAWLEAERGVSEDLPVRDVRLERRELPFPFDRLEEAMAGWVPVAPIELSPGPRLLALYTGR